MNIFIFQFIFFLIIDKYTKIVLKKLEGNENQFLTIKNQTMIRIKNKFLK